MRENFRAIVHWHLHPQRLPALDTTTPLKFVKGVGPARAEMLETKGLVTVEDLLAYAPFRYEDRTNVKTIAQLAPGEMATVIAEVQSAHLRGFRRRNLGLFEAIFKDSSKERLLAKWFHGGYLADRFLPGARVSLYGKVEFDSYTGDLLIMHPEFEILTGDDSDGDAALDSSLHTGRIVAVYEGAGKVTTRALRSLMHRVLESVEPLRRPSSAHTARAPETPRSVDRHPRAALPRPGHRPAHAERLSHSRALASDLRRILLAGVRPVAEAFESALAARNFVRIERSRAREDQSHAAVQADRRAEARARRDRARTCKRRIP